LTKTVIVSVAFADEKAESSAAACVAIVVLSLVAVFSGDSAIFSDAELAAADIAIDDFA
jgi:hypothetical protein